MSMIETMAWMVPASAVAGCCVSAMACFALVRQAVGTARARTAARLLLSEVDDRRLFDAVKEARRDPGDRMAVERLILIVRHLVEGMPDRRRRWVLRGLDNDSSAERRSYVLAVTDGVLPLVPDLAQVYPRQTTA